MKHNLDLINIIYSEQELEENIILFKKVDWYYISECQNLSEKFIEKYSDKVDWDYISTEQVLSEKFIMRNINKIHINYLMENDHISENIKNKIKLEVDLLKEII